MLDGAGSGGKKNCVGVGGYEVPGPPPVPGPLPLPVPVPVPDPVPPPVPGPDPGPPEPSPAPVVVTAPVVDDGVGIGVSITGLDSATFGGTIFGTGLIAVTSAALACLICTNCRFCPRDPPPPPPAGPGPPPPTAGFPSKVCVAIGPISRNSNSPCAKREARNPFHRPSFLPGTPSGGLYFLGVSTSAPSELRQLP